MQSNGPNFIVPTPPAGDSSKRAASTEFVTGATSSFQTQIDAIEAELQSHWYDFRYFGAVAGQDCSAALNAAIAEANCNTLFIPEGNWYLDTAPSTITRNMSIIGVNSSLSVLVSRHTGTGLVFTGSLPETGGSLRDITISFDIGSSTATAGVQLVSQSGGGSPDFFQFHDINITSTGSSKMQYGIVLDGNARTTGTVGLRNVVGYNISIFNTTVAGFEARHCRVCAMNDVHCFTGGGTTNAVAIGGSGSSTKTDTFFMNGLLSGDLTVDHATRVIASGGFQAVTLTSNSSECNIVGASTSTSDSGTGNVTSLA